MQRLQKAIAERGVASRRKAEELIAEGRVSVDGHIVRTPGTQVADTARIEVDGRLLGAPARHRYLLLNKPVGTVSTARDDRGRKTVVDLVGARERLYPVGRLDADSEGLLVMTNDGEWAERALHPRFGHEREYEATVTGVASGEAIAALRRGVRLDEGVAKAISVRVVAKHPGGAVLRVVLRTGWKRQVRRMCAACGLKVTRLVRVRFGALVLGSLKPGSWRELSAKEISSLA